MITIISMPVKLEVVFEGSLEVSELSVLERALFNWAPAVHGRFVLTTDVLTYDISKALNSIFSSALMVALKESNVSFIFQFNGLQADTLDGLFETPGKSFPENTSFICLDQEKIDLWVYGLILALENDKLSDNTFVDLSLGGQLLDKQCERLKPVLGAPKAPQKLMLMYFSEGNKLEVLNSTDLKPQLETVIEAAAAEEPPSSGLFMRPELRRTTKGFFEAAKNLDSALNGSPNHSTPAETVDAIFSPLNHFDASP